MLVEQTGGEDGEDDEVVGRAAFQGPDVDGVTRLELDGGPRPAVGDLVRAVVVASEGVDLVARPLGAGDDTPADGGDTTA